MARPKKEAVVKQTSLPESPNDRKLLDSVLNEIVGYMQEIDKQTDYIKGAKEVLTDVDGKLNLCPKYVGRLIKAAYDTSKIEQQTKDQQEAVDDFKLLKGGECDHL